MPPSRGRTLRHDAEHQLGVGDVGAADGVAADALTLLRDGAAHLAGITDRRHHEAGIVWTQVPTYLPIRVHQTPHFSKKC